MRKLIFALAFGALLHPDYGFSLGLGEIEVNSSLNQQLEAEIELLSAVPEDAETLIVKLASREEFMRAGIDRPFLLSDLQFETVIKNGLPWIKVKSSKPIREPFLNFLLEIDWPKGHLLREYTILLDPPVFMEQVTEDISRPAMSEAATAGQAPVESSAEAGGFRPAVTAAPRPSAAPAARPQGRQAAPATQFGYQPGGYRIQNGDTAWSLAESMRPDQSISVEQMMLAMLRTNPEVFINENVNGLKRGYVLRMPDYDEITSMSQAESLALVRQQNALWREYKQARAAGEPASAMDTGAAAGIEGGAVEAADARLEIVSAGTGTTASGAMDPTNMSASELRGELALAREALESERVEKEELQDRVASLEGQIDRMKSLLTLQDDDLAGLQMQAAEVPPAQAGMPMDEMPEQVGTGMQDMDMDMMPGEAMPETDTMAETEVGEAEAEQQTVFVDEQAPADEVGTQEVAQPAQQPPPDMVVTSPVPVTMPQQQGPLAALLGNPVLLAGAGGGLLLVIALIVLIVKRRAAGQEEELAASLAAVTDVEEVADMVADEDVDTRVSDEEVEQHMAAAEAVAETEEDLETSLVAEEDFDTDSTLVLPEADDTIVTQAPEQAAETEDEGDDVTAEADVYLAYGIYQQAEELLQNAIKEHPERDTYRVKLAETYFASKNTDAFVNMAEEMHERNAGADTAAWSKVAAIGKELCPEHRLFKDAEMASDMDMDDLMPKSPEPMDIDLGKAEEEPLAPDLDFSLDEAETPDSTKLEQTAVLDQETDKAEGIPEDVPDEEGVEFDLAETEAILEEPQDEEFSLDIEASELQVGDEEAMDLDVAESDIDFDLDVSDEAEEQLTAEPAAEPAAEDEANALDIDMDELDIEAAAAQETAEADEGGLDFDLGATEEDAAPVALETGAEAESAAEAEVPEVESRVADQSEDEFEEDIDLTMLDDVDEVSTKLDLARAYLDMGDAEGTRSILDEVMAEGTDEQKQEAEELLKQLDS